MPIQADVAARKLAQDVLPAGVYQTLSQRRVIRIPSKLFPGYEYSFRHGGMIKVYKGRYMLGDFCTGFGEGMLPEWDWVTGYYLILTSMEPWFVANANYCEMAMSPQISLMAEEFGREYRTLQKKLSERTTRPRRRA